MLSPGTAMATAAEPLDGRDVELERLDGVLAALAAGSPRVVALAGEPGIGKTRLLSELAARADAQGCLALEGRGLEFERELPFSLFVDACDEYMASLDAPTVQRLAGEGLAELAGILPSLQSLAPAVTEARLVDERYRAHRAVRQLCDGLAARRPLLLAFDDVQWADEASVELLAHLVRRPPAGRVTLALAHRAGQLPPRLVEAIDIATLEQRLDRIELRTLSRAEAAHLLEGVDPPAREALFRASGGNPFYLQQLARAPTAEREGDQVAAAGVRPGDDPDVPPAVAQAIARELGALPEDTRTLLEAAAVSGDPFEPDVAAEIAELADE